VKDLLGEAIAPIALPFSRLFPVDLIPSALEQLTASDAIVFPSPFSIEATLAACLSQRSVSKMPIFGLIGSASFVAFEQRLSELNVTLDNAHIVHCLTPPFDAAHLAPLLRAALDKHKFNRPALVTVLSDKAGVTAQDWSSWLSESVVSTVQGYRSELIVYPINFIASQTWVNEAQTLVYFTSTQAVIALANELKAPNSSLAPTKSKALSPTAVVIHPNIAAAVAKNLGWRVVEINPGTASLINFLQCPI
jgi:uroporphyrinogen-III synthase